MAKVKRRYLPIIINGLLFYIGWLFCVASAAGGLPYLGLLGAMGVVAYHLAVIKEKKIEFFFIASVTVTGFFVETGMIKFRVLEFTSPNTLIPGYAPFWLLGIYAMFATTVNHSLRWLQPYLFLAAFLGGLGGMVSYAAGERIGAVTFLVGKGGSVMVVGIAWFILMPLFYLYNKELTTIFKKT
ncbi:MAG: hypothetical protein K940chlam7_01163 [Chlamydiae bacterium]|nr:hypothetical protein [Chlamydiota bacterium]